MAFNKHPYVSIVQVHVVPTDVTKDEPAFLI